jgi:hypothetical protein
MKEYASLPLLMLKTKDQLLAVVSFANELSGRDIQPIEIVGAFSTKNAEMKPSHNSFVQNKLFADFLHETIGKHAPSTPSMRQAARQRVEGWIYLLDGRTPTPEGDVPLHDIFGGFEVRGGTVVTGSYHRFDEHLLYTELGFFQLEDALRLCIMFELGKRYAGTSGVNS